MSPETAAKKFKRALLCHKKGQLDRAAGLYRKVLQHNPEQCESLQLLSSILRDQGEYEEAENLIQRALSVQPESEELHNTRGRLLKSLGNLEEAKEEFETAIDCNPAFADAYNNLGTVLDELGEHDRAADCCRRATELNPEFAAAHNNLGLALMHGEHYEEAEDAYSRACELKSPNPGARSNLAVCYMEQNRLSDAEKVLLDARSGGNASSRMQNNLAKVYNLQGRFEESVVVCEQALEDDPDNVRLWNNLGTALMGSGDYQRAMDSFDRAIELAPTNPEPHLNRALLRLLLDEWKEGLREYRWRFRTAGKPHYPDDFSVEMWDDPDETPESLLVWAEQGVGDEAQFFGLIPRLKDRGIEPILECCPRMVPLLRRSFPDLTVCRRRENAIPEKACEKEFTHHIPLLSVLSMVKTDPGEVEVGDYLTPNNVLANKLRKRYEGPGTKLLVGVSWRSGNTQEGPRRSMAITDLAPLLAAKGVTGVNLQYGETYEDRRRLQRETGIELIHDSSVNPLENLDRFAAQVAAMDLVISIDNSTVHFAGALGVETWTLLPEVPDWRWGVEGQKTHWYKKMTLFRQKSGDGWPEVIERVKERLEAKV